MAGNNYNFNIYKQQLLAPLRTVVALTANPIGIAVPVAAADPRQDADLAQILHDRVLRQRDSIQIQLDKINSIIADWQALLNTLVRAPRNHGDAEF